MTEAELLLLVHQLMPADGTIDKGTLGEAAAAPGAYALILHLAVPVRFSRTGMASASLSGWYVYAGSARGSGGIRARLQRHFRPGKTVHWHVDELTNAADRLLALAYPQGAECDIVDRLLRSSLFQPALRRFGSSDCKRCPAHLLKPVPDMLGTRYGSAAEPLELFR